MCLPLSSLPQGFETKRDRFKLLTACFVKAVSEGGYDVGVGPRPEIAATARKLLRAALGSEKPRDAKRIVRFVLLRTRQPFSVRRRSTVVTEA